MTLDEIKIIIIIVGVLIFIMSLEGIICFEIGETKGWLKGLEDGKMFYMDNKNEEVENDE